MILNFQLCTERSFKFRLSKQQGDPGLAIVHSPVVGPVFHLLAALLSKADAQILDQHDRSSEDNVTVCG